MMRALIDTINKQVVLVQSSSSFAINPPLLWVDCEDDATPATHTWDGSAVVLDPNKPKPRWYVLKSTIRSRLGTNSMGLDALPSWWGDAPVFVNDNTDLIAYLLDINQEPSVILARDGEALTIFGKAPTAIP